MRVFDILQGVADTAFKSFATKTFDQLTEAERVTVLIWSLIGEVGNGGFDQFYYNSSGEFSAETVHALSLIGATRTAELLKEANHLFPTHPPPRERKARIAQLDSFTDKVNSTWDRLEGEFYQDPDGLEERLYQYLVHQGLVEQEGQ